MSSNHNIINTSGQVSDLCRSLDKCEFITIDTEFMREKTYYPKLCLIQISDPDKNAVAIDPLTGNPDLSPLFELLTNKNILKVFHAARQDLEIFYNLMNKVVTPFFDTQIAAMVCGYGDSVGYNNLVFDITGKKIDKGPQFMDWSHRPMSEKQINYALGDVTHLCDIYRHLEKELNNRGRMSWLEQEEKILGNPATYENNPYDAWKRVKIRSPSRKTLAVLRELAAWREKQAQELNIPKNRVLRDDTLTDMASQAPQNKGQLKKIRGISKELADGRTGEALLTCIDKALKTPQEEWPKARKRKTISPQASATIDILKMLLKIKSTESEVAAKLLASQSDLEAIALDDNADVPALKGWRREVFGQDALDLKNGKSAIGLKDGKIKKYQIKETA